MSTPNTLTTISQDIYALREHFVNVSAYPGINFEKEAAFAMQALAGNDYAIGIAVKNPQSVRDAVTNVAAIGISLNPALKQAYLVPRKDRICLDISYMGLIHLAIDTGSILWAQANVVRENDSFIINGYGKPPTHGHDPFAKAAARGPIKGAYVVVKTPDDEYLTHTMTIDEIHSTRDRSEAWKNYAQKMADHLLDPKKNFAPKPIPWVSDETEMVKKTVVKQAQKYWPKTDRTSRVDEAVHLLNTDGGEGFSVTKPGGAVQFPVNVLNDWIDNASKAPTSQDLTEVWQAGLAEIKPSKDMAAYNAFKAAVVARGEVLNNTPTDVVVKPVKQDVQKQSSANLPPAPSFAETLERMVKAKNSDALDIAADWIKDVADESQRAELNDKYDELKARFAK